ncbi:MAG: aldo/keto reductase, partial [Spirochaetales bacterium]|nr:aldo/keto reductase [Spirochaetales bacterium]
MEYRKLGTTGIQVSFLGFGAGHIGSPVMSEDAAGTLLNRALDRGVNFIDTARGYGLSEERIGRHLSWRRKDFFLSTKGGYGVEGVQDWTYAAVVTGAEQALQRLQTDHMDVYLLHSCPKDVFIREDIRQALHDLKKRGLALHTGYSGENDDLDAALGLPEIEVIETSINLTDQGNLKQRLVRAAHKGVGVIAKRPLANAFWRFSEAPVGNYAHDYWVRWAQMMALVPALADLKSSISMDEFAFFFVLASSEISTAIVGTG